jgi:hypothetical protein
LRKMDASKSPDEVYQQVRCFFQKGDRQWRVNSGICLEHTNNHR